MRILALDLSTICSGFAIIDATAPVTDNIKLLRFGTIEPFEGLSESEKYFVIAHQAEMLIRVFHPDELIIEDTFYSKDPTVLKKLNRLAGHVQAIWYKLRRKDAIFYMAVSARKTFGISGKATKPEIVEAVNKYCGLRGRLKDHNAADAVVMAYHHALSGADKAEQLVDPVLPEESTDFVKPIIKEKRVNDG